MTTGTECSTLGGVQKRTKESMKKNENEQMKRNKKNIIYSTTIRRYQVDLFNYIIIYTHTP